MSPAAKKTSITLLRWGIAVAGICFVVMKMSFHDRVLLVDPATHRPMAVRVLNDAHESDPRYQVQIPQLDGSLKTEWINQSEVWIKPDGSSFSERGADGKLHKDSLLAVKPGRDEKHPDRLLVKKPGGPEVIDPSRVDGVYESTVPYPRIDIGLIRLVRAADPRFLLAALAILPVAFFVTSFRWHLLLEALDIRIPAATTFVVNMVGAFYNSFMPGSTGGDLIRAYYASKHTTHRVRAVMSVIVDRVLGLLALIILGGTMACFQLDVPECRRVAIGCVAMLSATIVGAIVFYNPFLHRVLGVEFILKRLPMQRQVGRAVEALHLYGRRPWISLFAILITLPVHITTIISAYLSGRAFGLPLPFFYYWVAVPVIVLVAAIPISPQGAGVMEFFAIELTRREGVPTSQAIALAMSIRLGSMFWNLVAGLFVLRGGYHAPTAGEQKSLSDADGADDQAEAIAAPVSRSPAL